MTVKSFGFFYLTNKQHTHTVFSYFLCLLKRNVSRVSSSNSPSTTVMATTVPVMAATGTLPLSASLTVGVVGVVGKLDVVGAVDVVDGVEEVDPEKGLRQSTSKYSQS